MEKEVTEREQKLLGYIKSLLVMVSIQATYIQYHKRIRDWLLDNMTNMKANELETDLIGYLNSEFGLEYEKVTEEELFGKNNGA
jgi:hypothetical protein